MTGTSIDKLVGTGVEEMTFDTEAFADQTFAGIGGSSAVDRMQWESLDLQESDDVRMDDFDDENDVLGETLLSGAAGGRDVGSGADFTRNGEYGLEDGDVECCLIDCGDVE